MIEVNSVGVLRARLCDVAHISQFANCNRLVSGLAIHVLNKFLTQSVADLRTRFAGASSMVQKVGVFFRAFTSFRIRKDSTGR